MVRAASELSEGLSLWNGSSSVLSADDGAGGDDAAALRHWLRSIRLDQYLEALVELGAATMDDIHNLEYEDLDDLGLKKLEKRRFWKAVQAQQQQK